MTTEETAKVAELLKDERFGLFTTVAPDGTLISRPMALQEVEFDGARSRIAWIVEDEAPKVPVRVAATGPHVIEVAARHADGIDLTVGAEEARVRWGIETARAAGHEPAIGAYVNVAVHPDRATARDLVRGSVAILARFGTEGAPTTGLSDVTKSGMDHLAAAYDEAAHGQSKAPAASGLGDDFIDGFAVVGSPDEVTARLRGLNELGIGRLIVVAGSLDADPGELATSNELFASEVLPALRA